MLSINQLTLHNFRNYEFAEIDPGSSCIILTGANGAGKTNILEAISLLSPGRGFRKAKLRDICHQPSDSPWVISADITGLDGEAHIGTSLDIESAIERRLIKVDGEKARGQALLAEHLSISWQTPQMDGLFLASDGERRRYLDRLVYNFDAAHLARVSSYEHAMRERNRLLVDGRMDEAWLNTLEENMAQAAIAIATARLDILERLNVSIQSDSGKFPRAIMQMQGDVEQLAQVHAASDAEHEVRNQLRDNRRKDAAAGRTTYGSHKSLWLVTHAENNMPASYCSTGEQKALLLSILLAHARTRKSWLGEAPILLLDETVAHLDVNRREALAEEIRALKTQTWLTGTDAADFAAFEGFSCGYCIENGSVV